jgi:hypothetical protein
VINPRRDRPPATTRHRRCRTGSGPRAADGWQDQSPGQDLGWGTGMSPPPGKDRSTVGRRGLLDQVRLLAQRSSWNRSSSQLLTDTALQAGAYRRPLRFLRPPFRPSRARLQSSELDGRRQNRWSVGTLNKRSVHQLQVRTFGPNCRGRYVAGRWPTQTGENG